VTNGERKPVNWSVLAAIVATVIAVFSVIFSAGSRVTKLESSVETLTQLGLDARLVHLEAVVDEQTRLISRLYERQLDLDRRTRDGGPQ
jgi:hypothetical protein